MITGLKYVDKDVTTINCSFVKEGSSPNKIIILDEYNHEHEINHTEIFLSYTLSQEIKDELYDKSFSLFKNNIMNHKLLEKYKHK